jgi:fructose-1,6-bisphosphatase
MCVLAWFDHLYLNLVNVLLGTIFAIWANRQLLKEVIQAILQKGKKSK